MASSLSGLCRSLYRYATVGAYSRCTLQKSDQVTVSSCRHLLTTSALRGEAENKLPDDNELVPERLYSKIKIKVKGADFRVLDSYSRYVITAAKALNINVSGKSALPTRIQKFTVLKSAHIFKKHRVQYEIRTHVRQLQIKEITGTTADVFLEYIQRNLPEGVSMTVYQEQMDTLPTLLMTPYQDPSAPPLPTKDGRKKKW